MQIFRRRITLSAQLSEINHDLLLITQLRLPLCFGAPFRGGSFSFLRGLARDNFCQLRFRLFLWMKRHRIHRIEGPGLLFFA
jgi:hypothetical protein